MVGWVWAFLGSTTLPGGSDSKKSACSEGNPGFIPGSGGSPREVNGNPLRYSCMENLMDGGACTVHGVAVRHAWVTHCLSTWPLGGAVAPWTTWKEMTWPRVAPAPEGPMNFQVIPMLSVLHTQSQKPVWPENSGSHPRTKTNFHCRRCFRLPYWRARKPSAAVCVLLSTELKVGFNYTSTAAGNILKTLILDWGGFWAWTKTSSFAPRVKLCDPILKGQ